MASAKKAVENTTNTDQVDEYKQNLKDAQSALLAEFNALVNDTEALLKHTSEAAGEQVDELRQTLTDNIARAKTLLKDSEQSLKEQAQAAVNATETYVQDKPLQSIAIAAGVGLLLGLLIGRR